MNPFQLLSPEAAHQAAVWALANLPMPFGGAGEFEALKLKLWHLNCPNPLGMAAGFDKHAEAYNGLFSLGFGAVEVGSITPEAQPGNEKPRVFRLKEDRAIINRYGFNSQGHSKALNRLKAVPSKGILGVNLGKNKASEEAAPDYVKGVQLFGALADYLVINVSSPNTPGLRAEQQVERLEPLVKACLAARDQSASGKPLLVKLAPDLEDAEIDALADLALRLQVDGLIISNTTLARPDSLQSAYSAESGGLSGRPLFGPSTQVLAAFARATKGQLPLIGVGGVENAETAYQKILHGASLVQLYSAMTYAGPGFVSQILNGLVQRLDRDGFKSINQAIGAAL